VINEVQTLTDCTWYLSICFSDTYSSFTERKILQ